MVCANNELHDRSSPPQRSVSPLGSVENCMQNQIDRIRSSFDSSLQSVNELLDFDRIVLDFAIHGVNQLSEKLKTQHGINNPYLSADNTLKALKNIREHDSMRTQYKRVFNQFLVLLVSHFASTVRDLFESAIDEAVKTQKFEKINRATIEVTLADLQKDAEARSSGEILAIQNDISFQDMQSIARAFQDYFDFVITRDTNVNNIILAQACRHAIVHSGARVDKRLQAQVSGAKPRTVKPSVDLDSEILFSPEEVKLVGESMKLYLEQIFILLLSAFGTA